MRRVRLRPQNNVFPWIQEGRLFQESKEGEAQLTKRGKTLQEEVQGEGPGIASLRLRPFARSEESETPPTQKLFSGDRKKKKSHRPRDLFEETSSSRVIFKRKKKIAIRRSRFDNCGAPPSGDSQGPIDSSHNALAEESRAFRRGDVTGGGSEACSRPALVHEEGKILTRRGNSQSVGNISKARSARRWGDS